ncbi:unnamed protein product [Caenorhabditis auriculariae]|uniref:Rab-GAP TBC domain-containing protein n=1 Tax=Caenorhabditis auriculariae TaxID=2777116 RepID=A0A8S1HI72_9PELO|nr:unnamed protein product [Caenorhabditis auriculariae]
MSEACTAAETTAEDLVERGGRPPASPKPARPPLTITRQGSSIVSSVDRGSVSRDYVYSLHHNFKSSLLYGKNNVAVAVNGGKESVKDLGYLSLHKNVDGNLTLKWTPNQLMHASSQPSSAHSKDGEFAGLWRHAIHIELQDIIYIHLHQRDENSPACLTFVNCEGVQSAPLQLPAGQHSLAFLTSLETGLAPLLRLDPPLWTGQSKEKILPRLRKRSTAQGSPPMMMDYVFRLVRTSGLEPAPEDDEPDSNAPSPIPPIHDNCVSLPNSPYFTDNVDNLVNLQIGKACQSMQHQILARAFYGWLTYVRHLRTVRKHLLHLVNTENAMKHDDEALPVDEAFWKKCRTETTEELEREFLQRVYLRGIEGKNPKELRRQAWPYLLGLYAWTEAPEPKTSEFTAKYREEVDEWRILEAEVRRRDEEAFIAARQKRGSPTRECSVMSDVFEDPEEATCSSEWLVTQFATNLHRIDKDVERCDRNLIFFSNKDNLESLRRVMCTYVRRNLEEGYIQGMCDLLAPLLVIFEDEALTLECFTILMGRLRENFPQRSGMDQCLSNLRSLIQVVDPQIFTLLTGTGDFTHLYFSYRWFLLDFKRELSYECTYKVWETIWAAGRTVSPQFALFFALAMVTNYRDVIVDNNMDFTDMIKFFNEMAERHDCARLLQAARNHLYDEKPKMLLGRVGWKIYNEDRRTSSPKTLIEAQLPADRNRLFSSTPVRARKRTPPDRSLVTSTPGAVLQESLQIEGRVASPLYQARTFVPQASAPHTAAGPVCLLGPRGRGAV